MAVYKRSYQPYRGLLTRRWPRCFVLTRYAWRELFASRFFLGFFIACLVPVLGFAGFLFAANSQLLQLLFAIGSKRIFSIGTGFFTAFLELQAGLAFLLTCWAGPRLVSGDLTNGALPLFLSRPFSRAEYVIGKFAVLTGLLSWLTWIPALLLLFLQGGLSSQPWLGAHLWMVAPIVWCSLVWIGLLSLVALAASAWVRWRIIAIAAIFATFTIPAGFGGVMNAVLRTNWGHLLDLFYVFHMILTAGFRAPMTGTGALPQSAGWGMVALVSVVSLELLQARLRGAEVVRG